MELLQVSYVDMTPFDTVCDAMDLHDLVTKPAVGAQTDLQMAIYVSALRFDIAWSRITILQEGKLAQIIETFNIDQSVLFALEDRFKTLEPLIEEFATQDMAKEMQTCRCDRWHRS